MSNATLAGIAKDHDGYITSVIESFQRELSSILAAAEARLQADLREMLVLDDKGRVIRSVGNAQALRSLDDLFMQELDKCGYQHLLDAFVNQFPQQFAFFQRTLDALSSSMAEPLPRIAFTPRDLQVFQDYGLTQRDVMTSVVSNVAATANNRILLSYGGLPFKELVGTLAVALHKSIPESAGVAETATATFYRMITDIGFKKIEDDLPSMEMLYRYFGPDDKVTRPFCKHLLECDQKTWTRAQIDEMNNGQLPNVFQTCGGFRCRHWWLLDTAAILASAA